MVVYVVLKRIYETFFSCTHWLSLVLKQSGTLAESESFYNNITQIGLSVSHNPFINLALAGFPAIE